MADFNPNALRMIANGLRAQSQLQALETGPQMRQAINEMETPLQQVQGQGFAAQAPSILNVLATTAMQRQGQSKVRGLDARADVLRGQIADSAMAQQQEAYNRQLLEQQAKAEQAQAANQSRMDVAGLNASTRLEAARIAADARAAADARKTEEARLNREQKERLSKSRGGAAGLKPTAGQVNNYMAADASLATLKELRAMIANTSDKVRQDIDQPLKHTLVDLIPLEGAKRMAENITTETPEAKAYYSKLYQVGSRLTKEMTGLSGTKYEAKDRQKWSPAAVGIDQPERERRIADIEDYLSKNKKELQSFYPSHFGDREDIDLGEQAPNIRQLGGAEKATGADPLNQARNMLKPKPEPGKRKPANEMTEAEIDAELRGE